MPSTTYLGNKLLDFLLGGTSYSVPATLYIGLYTTVPVVAGTGTEVSGGSYSRLAVTNDTTNFPNASAKSKSNGVAFTFVQATALWGTVVAVTVHDAVSAGNMLMWAELTVPKTVNNGDTPSFAIGQLVFNAV